MKSIKFQIFWAVLLLLISCGYSYRENVKSTDLNAGGKLKEDQAYIYSTFLYTDRTPITAENDAYLALDIISRSEAGGKEIYIPMSGDKGYIFTDLKPGEYTLTKIIFNLGGAVINSVPVNKDFKVEANRVFYFGDFKLKVLRTTQSPYYWWGVNAADDNFQNSIGMLNSFYSGITTDQFVNGYAALGSSIKPFEKREIYGGGSRSHKDDMQTSKK